MKICVTGAGGFVAGHLVEYLVARGHWVRGVDVKLPEFRESKAHEFMRLDLRDPEKAKQAVYDCDWVFGLAADMGGIGFITQGKAAIVHNNTLINHHTIEAARLNGVSRYFFTSSACAYPGFLQNSVNAKPLREEDAYPADAEDGYGWEKLYFERTCRHYYEDYGLETRIVRFHNTFGPFGTYEGGREKSPAALCRKIALANDGDEIEVWGDGEQTRSYNYIDDCIEGIYRLMLSDYREPLNLGQDRMVSINQLVDMIAKIAGKTIHKRYDLTKPQGVRGRNSDNTRLRQVLQWEPQVSLGEGLEKTYHWIAEQVNAKRSSAAS